MLEKDRRLYEIHDSDIVTKHKKYSVAADLEVSKLNMRKKNMADEKGTS